MEAISELESAIEHQTRLVDRWKQPSEPLLFETVRALDNVFCEELFYGPEHPSRLPLMDKTVMTWGVNQALERMVPDVLNDTQFRLFPSREDIQRQADGLLLQGGCLAKAQSLKIRIKAGAYDSRVDVPNVPAQDGISKSLIGN